MTLLAMKMFFLSPIYQWILTFKAQRKIKLRSVGEIFVKKNEFTTKYLAAERTERKDDMTRYTHYIEVLEWVMNGKGNNQPR